MKNKGFTLIELLAVIVILAIIALIATPIILGIIEDARKGAKENSAKLIVSTVEKAYASAYMLNDGKVPTKAAVMAQFNKDMDGAVWNGNEIKSTDGVVCEVTDTAGLSVICKIGTDEVASTSASMNLQ